MATTHPQDPLSTEPAHPPIVGGTVTRLRPGLVAEIRRRGRRLAKSYPTPDRVAKLRQPALTAVTNAHRSALTLVANPETSVAVLVSTLLDARHHLDVFEQADTGSGGGASDSADCIGKCDQLLKDCAESWGEAISETDIDIFDAETEDQDDGGGSINLDDNPLDVENNDPGDTGADDDSTDTRDDETGLTTFEAGVVAGFCALQYTACVAGCLISGAFG